MHYVDSNMEAAIARFVGGMTKGMDRMPFIEFLKVLLKNTDYLIPNASALKQSEKRAIKAKILKTVIEAADGSRSCTMAGSYGDSASVTINWLTTALTGKVSLRQLQDNAFSFQEAVAKRIADLRRSCLKQIETDAQAWLAANKTTVNDAISYGNFNPATAVFEIDPVEATNPGFLNIVEQMLAENRYRNSMFEGIVNGFTMPQLKYQFNQGANNASNLRFQFDRFNVINGLGFSDENYPNWFGFFFQEGTVGMLNWIPQDYRTPTPGGSVASNIGLKQSFPDPEIPGLIWALKTQVGCEDTTDDHGGDDDEVLKIQLSTDYAFNYSPTEDGSTPVFGAGSAEAPV